MKIVWRSSLSYFVYVSVIALSATVSAAPSIQYHGGLTQEGTLTFQAHVDLPSATAPTEDQVREQVRKQLLYLIGNMQYRAEGLHGTPSVAYKLSDLKTEQISPSLFRASYSYSSNVIVEKYTKPGHVKLDLPRDPDGVVSLADAGCNSNSSEPLWYAFTPHRAGCTLREGEHYDIYSGVLTVKDNTTETYPEYSKLAADDGSLKMAIFLNNEIQRSEGIVDWLKTQGFTERAWTGDEVSKFLSFDAPKGTIVEDFTRGSMTVRVFYGCARIENPDSRAFHYFYKDALENASVIAYGGHSGLGSNLDLKKIEANEKFTIQFPNRYQVLLLDGCITYGYYVDMYLARKATAQDTRGTKLMDVLTFGQESPGFDLKPIIAFTDMISNYVSKGERSSYQSITKEIYYSWFAIVGDEDNKD